jgi:nitrous oxidase accessory protein NosD
MIFRPAKPERRLLVLLSLASAMLVVPSHVQALPRDASTPDITAVNAAGSAVVSDPFTRTLSSGWGSSPVGGTYTLSGGASSFSVATDRGHMVVPAANTTRAAYLPSAARDLDARVQVNTDRLASGANHYAYLLLRRSSGGEYVAKLYFAPDGGIFIQLSRVSGGETPLTAPFRLPGITHAAGQQIWLRSSAVGGGPTRLSVKAWKAGLTEPPSWQLTATDSTAGLQGEGSIGLRAHVASGAINVPVRFSFDDFSVERADCPQPSSPPTKPYDAGLTAPFQCPDPVSGRSLDVRSYGATPNNSADDDAPAIRAAISAARAGDEVLLPGGTLHLKSGQINLKTGVSLRGQGRGATVLGAMYSSLTAVIYVPAGATNLRISDFAVRRVSGSYDAAVRLGNGRWDSNNSTYPIVSRVAIEGLLVEGHRRMGILLENTQHVLVRDNIVRAATALGGGGSGYGVSINFDRSSNNWVTGNQVGPTIRHAYLLAYRAHHNLLEHNTATGTTQDAFDLHGEDEYSNELRHNTVTDCQRLDPATGALTYPAGFGLGEVPAAGSAGMNYHDVTGPHNWIHHNTVRGCYAGVRSNNTNYTYIEDNVLHDNDVGIRIGDLRPSHFSRALRNDVRNNNVGLYLGEADDTIVRLNTSTTNSSRGLDVQAAAARYLITDNDFRSNGAPVRLLSSIGTYANNLE